MARENGEVPQSATYLIIGAGVFGLSTALHLIRSKPGVTVIMLDRSEVPNPASASYDLNKIIRADYRDPFYMKLALEACAAWQSDPLYKPHFHQSGMVFAENKGKCDAMLRNLATLDDDGGRQQNPSSTTAARLLSVEQARAAFPSLAPANLQGAERIYLNPQSGWADALPALRGVLRDAVARGVVLRRADVATLLLLPVDGGGRLVNGTVAAAAVVTAARPAGGLSCRGVRTNDGLDILADHIIVCAGAYTSKLLADSWPAESMLQAGDRLVAAAALSCTVRVLDPEKGMIHRGGPVVANELPHTAAESIPLNKDGLLKFNLEASFTNNQCHAASGQTISWPPESAELGRWTKNIPRMLRDEAQRVAENLYGHDLQGFEIESYRICWDSCTKDQEWIISPIDGCKNIFVAGGGSFHAWKFLPVLGRYVVEMMDGTLDPETAARWSWNRPDCSKKGACDSYAPKRDLKDLVDS